MLLSTIFTSCVISHAKDNERKKKTHINYCQFAIKWFIMACGLLSVLFQFESMYRAQSGSRKWNGLNLEILPMNAWTQTHNLLSPVFCSFSSCLVWHSCLLFQSEILSLVMDCNVGLFARMFALILKQYYLFASHFSCVCFFFVHSSNWYILSVESHAQISKRAQNLLFFVDFNLIFDLKWRWTTFCN